MSENAPKYNAPQSSEIHRHFTSLERLRHEFPHHIAHSLVVETNGCSCGRCQVMLETGSSHHKSCANESCRAVWSNVVTEQEGMTPPPFAPETVISAETMLMRAASNTTLRSRRSRRGKQIVTVAVNSEYL